MDYELEKIQKLLDAAEADIHSARMLLRAALGQKELKPIDPVKKAKHLDVADEGKVVEGTYMGEYMHGADGKEYPVPANYASKSKLVEGDILKLTIAENGSFIFKQIKPAERRKSLGTLVYGDGILYVNSEGKAFKVLQASVTYYKGEPGDQVTIIIPKEHDSSWAAIDNIVKKGALASPSADEVPNNQPSVNTEVKTDSVVSVEPVEPIEPVEPNTSETVPVLEANAKPEPESNLADTDQTVDSSQSNNDSPTIVYPEQKVTRQNKDEHIISGLKTSINDIKPNKNQATTDGDGVKELEI